MPEPNFIADLTWFPLDYMGMLLLATVLGGLIGLEREWSGKPAGFRTNLLICVGAAVLTDLSLAVAAGAPAGVPADPARIAAQIVSGIGFLGAGTIIQSRAGITGLTTAATMWVVAAIGMAVGAREYPEAIGATVLVGVVLWLLGRVEGLIPHQFEGRLRVVVVSDETADQVEKLLADRVDWWLVELERSAGELALTYRVDGRRSDWKALITDLMETDGVRGVKGS